MTEPVRDKRAGEGDPVAVVRELNRAWAEGEPERAGALLHPDVLFLQPGGAHGASGREACIASYADFLTRARVEVFEERASELHAAGTTAVVLYSYRVVYAMDGEQHDDTGADLYALTLSDAGWQVVWRSLLPGA